MNNKIKFSVFLLLISFISYAQGEANIWYFGKNAGLDFNSGNPVVLTDGQLYTMEGCATISNSLGQLLFYTDGIKVWNKKHEIMANGTNLKGHSSSTQSAIIVPKPDNPLIYYIFTVTELGYDDGVCYSEVDLSLNGGLGDITANKNISLLTPACEKVTAVKNSDDESYWVVIHGYGNNNFLSYKINSAGINLIPVISNVGPVVADDKDNTLGYLKFSPDGTKLICANNHLGVQLFDFEGSSGVIKNPVEVTKNNYENDLPMSTYGVEFSPSGKIAYITKGPTYYEDQVFQYDLTASDIPSTEKVIYTIPSGGGGLGALQLATDGKIYGSAYLADYLFAINNPDVLGMACGFVEKAIILEPGQNFQSGLPPFITSYFNIGIRVENDCLNDLTSFSLSGNQNIISASWDFGDGTTSTDINPTHTYLSAGTYTVSVTTAGTGSASTKTKDIVISKVPTASQPQDMLVCDDNNDGLHTFDLTVQNAAILNGQDPTLYKVKYFANNVAIPSPTVYTNTVAYQKEIITAEVSNNADSECKSSTSFAVDVFDSPLPEAATTIPDLTFCDNASVGTDNDGHISFDLTQRATSILKAQSATQFLITYYKDPGFTQLIATPTAYQNTNANEIIYVKVANKDNPTCAANTSFKVSVFALPTITNVVDLKQCDDDIDGFSVFNLEEAIAKITSNASNETIGFFKTLTDAQNNANLIFNPTNYSNTIVSNDVVYVRVTNSNACFRIAKLNLIVSTTQIPLNFSKTFTQCDDVASGTNTDGIATFDFSSVTNQVQAVFPSGQLLDITYYKNLNDALAEKNTIADISSYSNIGYPNSQKIYIRVDSQVNNDCLGLGGYITLNVEPIPVVKSLTQSHCDDDQDGLFTFDTTTLESQILSGLTNVTISYFDKNNNPLPSPLPNPFVTASQIVKVKITNTTALACSYDATIAFVVDDLPEAFPIPVSLTSICDDEVDPVLQDGKYPFDSSSFQNTIIGNQTGMTVNYYDANGNALDSPLPNPFVTATQNVKVEVINPLNASCSATIIIPFKVNPVPIIQLTGDELVCSDLPTFTKVINAGLLDETQKENYTYTWTLDGNLIADQNQYDLTVNKKGIYKVEATNSEGCSRIRTITVNASDKAKVQVDIVDLSSENSITVLVTGAGDYVFSLDEEFGDYQNNNVFTNVLAGIHTVFVKDLNGCGIVPKEVALLGIPNFFTPNQDGYNDTWNIKGVNTVTNLKTTVMIFDRYGKLIKELNPIGDGWDGTYIGQPMPATDYWYSIQLEDGRIFKGHFALKR